MIAISIDGRLVDPTHASISVLDRGLLYGDGLFEVLRTWDGIAVELNAHLDRLFASARVLQFKTMERAALEESVARTLAAAQGAAPVEDFRLRVVITRGSGPIGTRLGELGPGRTIVIVEPLPLQPSGVALAIVDWPLPRRTTHGHKTLAYIDHVIARELGAQMGADEAVRLDADGWVAEGATSNVFVVEGGRITTPPTDTGELPGITRDRVLACCAQLGIPAATEPISAQRLRSADEAFVTSALRGVTVVTRVDDISLASGPVTAAVAKQYLSTMRRQHRRDL